MKRVLNLYAGIGGNRKLWRDVTVTAVEINPKISKIYSDFFPDDEVIIADAHQYLLEHHKEKWDFIWSSPPCQTHTFLIFANYYKGNKFNYPDMRLYQEIILLKHFFKKPYCIENVVSYYEPLIKPQIIGKHYFWTNFYIPPKDFGERGIPRRKLKGHLKSCQDIKGFDLSNYKGINKSQILHNCVNPELGKFVFDCAFKNVQTTLKGV